MIASSILNTQRSKKTDKIWTPYDINLGLRNPDDDKKQKPTSMNKDLWKEYKSMLKACGKPVKKVKT